MFRLQHKLGGTGISAPQIGLGIRLIVIDNKEEGTPYVLINPKVSKLSLEQESEREQCSSLPHFFCKVKRHKEITVTAYDVFGKQYTIEASGTLARSIQHELDHLNGTLFTDHLESLELVEVRDPEDLTKETVSRIFS